eukprot:TRINITY_DN63600_c0_g1_i1.p1 TRINITY_DN63600_c0_g1~~TRINITY_DN63600_c0_g1_i1.p1  ORF type:complete len:644 (+),score=187.66 TRINITY_DN63600_c0_g1_i1:161-2092(+)
MELLTATKDGLIIFDALSTVKADEGDEDLDWSTGLTADGQQVKVVAKLPSPPNAFGHAWSSDGNLLGSVCDEGVKVYDANKGYKEILEIPKVAPDVGGRMGGVRNLQFSPKNSFLVTYEKWDPQFPENVHVWDIREGKAGTKLYSCTLRGYTSGALPVELLKWTSDESVCVEMSPGEGLLLRAPDLSDDSGECKKVTEKQVANFQVAPKEQKGSYYVAVYVPESPSGMVARVAVYHLADPSKPTTEVYLPAKVKDARMDFNKEGTELLALASSDIDETGSSYFGTTFLYWMSSDGKGKPLQVCGAKEGLVQDLVWSPTKNEFAVIVGMLPATVALYDGKTGKLLSNLGSSRRNTLKWNPFGRFLAVGGFGTLPGDLDFFDRSCEETVSSLRAALTVGCEWAPDGRHFLAATLAPRMNEGNQLSLYRYTGEHLYQILFKPKVVEARHEDTGAGARTKTQALLFGASWRPSAAYEDTPATPRGGPKRKKGLPDANENSGAAQTTTQAYRPKGVGAGGSSLVAAMMRGEIDAPAATPQRTTDGQGWEVKEVKPLEEWEIRKLERERKKEQEKREQKAKEDEKQALREVEQGVKDAKRKLKQLKEELANLEQLKEKDWDELTDEDEELLAGEIDLRAQIAELEKGKA